MSNQIRTETLERGHQAPNAQPWFALFAFGAVAAMVALVLLAVWLIQVTLYGGNLSTPPPLEERADTIPPPRLQASPARDRALLEARTENILNSYGWIDQEQGIVHIPIDRAIELLLARGLEHPFGAAPGSAANTGSMPLGGDASTQPAPASESSGQGAQRPSALPSEPPTSIPADQDQQEANERAVGEGASAPRQSALEGAKSRNQDDSLPPDRPDLPVRTGPAGLLPGVSPKETGAVQPEEREPPVDPEGPPSLLGPAADPGAEAPRP